MEPQMYFIKESPDYNFGLWGKPERIAANRVVLCTMTEFGICNNRKMSIREYSDFIETLQMTTGTIKEESKIFMKTIPLCFSSITMPNDVSIECSA